MGKFLCMAKVFSPFTHYLELFGYQNAIIGLVKKKEKVKAVLDRLTDAAIAWGTAQARHGVDAVLISSAFAGGGFHLPENVHRICRPVRAQAGRCNPGI